VVVVALEEVAREVEEGSAIIVYHVRLSGRREKARGVYCRNKKLYYVKNWTHDIYTCTESKGVRE